MSVNSKLAILALAFSSVLSAQLAPSATTLAVSASASDTQVILAYGAGVSAGQTLYIDREALSVSRVSGAIAYVLRGTIGTRETPHNAGTTVYYGRGDSYLSSDLLGACSADPSGVYVRISSGATFGCTAGLWTQLNGAGGGTASPVAVASTSVAGVVKPSPSDFTVAMDGTISLLNKLVLPAGTGVLCYNQNAPLASALSIGVGGVCPSLSAAIAPTTLSLVQGNAGTATLTYTATGLSSGIVPSCTGIPMGVTATYGTNPVAQTGGTSLITLTAAAGATLGGPITISCIGTSGATVSAAATFALTVTAAPAGTLTLGTISTYSAQSLTGSADWVDANAMALSATGAQNWLDRKLGGTIFTAGASNTLIGTVAGDSTLTALSWTDGTVTATSSNGTAPEMTATAGYGNSFTLTSDATARTLTVFAGVGYAAGGMTVTASSSVAGVASVQHTVSIATVNTARAFTFTFQNAGTVTITLASTGAGVILAAAKVI